MKPTSDSLFDRLAIRLRRTRIFVPLSLFLMLLPIALAFVDGQWEQFLSSGLWRVLLIQPAIVIYILLLSPFMQRAREDVITGLRPIVQVTDQEFEQLVAQQSRLNPRGELIAVSTGALVGWFMRVGMALGVDSPWLQAYQAMATVVMYAAIAWVIYGAVAGTGLYRALLRQPLEVDVFDISPFEPVGRESVMVSVAFIIGATLAMVFSITGEFVLEFESFLAYVFFACVAVLVFFLNLRDTHRVLADAKQQELDLAQTRISQAYQALKREAQGGEAIQAIAIEIDAWISYKERLGKTRTWPYNTEIIRNLLISTLMPVGVAALRRLGAVLLSLVEWRF
ncbi:MAG: hypothetical protein GWN58_52100 [Anaerolineae bacterium]|nr:hypothetical protein [Anaerolineae bacterium]